MTGSHRLTSLLCGEEIGEGLEHTWIHQLEDQVSHPSLLTEVRVVMKEIKRGQIQGKFEG